MANFRFTNEESQRLHELETKENEAKLFIERTTCWKVKNDRTKQLARIKQERLKIKAIAKKRGMEDGR